jgi:hypothetical protein
MRVAKSKLATLSSKERGRRRVHRR